MCRLNCMPSLSACLICNCFTTRLLVVGYILCFKIQKLLLICFYSHFAHLITILYRHYSEVCTLDTQLACESSRVGVLVLDEEGSDGTFEN